jgi:hypothetical protein
MKQIQLKVVEFDQGVLDYKKELTTIFHTPADPKAGAEIEEMRRSIRVLDALDKATDVLELEDADYNYLRERINKARFGMVHPAIVQFIDDMVGV